MLCCISASLPFGGWPANVLEVAEELYGAVTGAAMRSGMPRMLIDEGEPVPVDVLCRAATPGSPVVAGVGTELRSAVGPAARELAEGARSAWADAGETGTVSVAAAARTKPDTRRQVERMAMDCNSGRLCL